MTDLSPEVQLRALEYLIAQEQLSKGGSNAAFFFSILFAFIFGAVLMRLWSR